MRCGGANRRGTNARTKRSELGGAQATGGVARATSRACSRSRTLRAKTEALKQGCVATQRLVRARSSRPSRGATGRRRGRETGFRDADGAAAEEPRRCVEVEVVVRDGGGNTTTPGFEPADLDDSPSEVGFVFASDGGDAAAERGTPRTPSEGRGGGRRVVVVPPPLTRPADEDAGASRGPPETFRVAMDGLAANSLRKSAAVLVAEAEGDAAEPALASAAKKALASIMDSPVRVFSDGRERIDGSSRRRRGRGGGSTGSNEKTRRTDFFAGVPDARQRLRLI